jgi:hypothetical protein
MSDQQRSYKGYRVTVSSELLSDGRVRAGWSVRRDGNSADGAKIAKDFVHISEEEIAAGNEQTAVTDAFALAEQFVDGVIARAGSN